jgi:hypothetical protein
MNTRILAELKIFYKSKDVAVKLSDVSRFFT